MVNGHISRRDVLRGLVGVGCLALTGCREVLASASQIGQTLVTHKGNFPLGAGYTTLFWSPDSTKIAAGGFAIGLEIIDASTGQIVRKIAETSGYALAWSPDGQYLATVSSLGNVISDKVSVWRAATGELVSTYTGHSTIVYSVAWSPDSKRIVSTDGATVQIWEALSRKRLLTYRGHADNGATDARWSPDGKYIVSWTTAQGSGFPVRTIHVWESQAGKWLYTREESAHSIAWSRDSKRLVSSHSDGTIKVWDAPNGKNLQSDKLIDNQILSVDWSPDGNRVVASGGSTQYFAQDGFAHIFDLLTKQSYIYKGHTYTVTRVQWSPDGQRIASCSYDPVLKIWSA